MDTPGKFLDPNRSFHPRFDLQNAFGVLDTSSKADTSRDSLVTRQEIIGSAAFIYTVSRNVWQRKVFLLPLKRQKKRQQYTALHTLRVPAKLVTSSFFSELFLSRSYIRFDFTETWPLMVQESGLLGCLTADMCKGVRGWCTPSGNDPVRYPHPPSIFGGWDPPLEFLDCGTPSE